jgi:hypothetical protein
MKKLRWNIVSDLGRDGRGSEIAETAMILPLFFMIFLAIFWFGQAYRIYGTLAHATRSGAEAAVAPLCATCTGTYSSPTNAQTAVYNALAAAHLDKNNLVPWGGPTPKWTPPPLCACGGTSSSCMSTPKTCDPSVADVCVQVNVQIAYSSGGGMGSCGISVSARYKYPYSFPIPFTSLDLNKILLPGQAEMREETQ